MNLLILGSHGILEYDELRMFSDLGYDAFMPGGYSKPSEPGETLRPALPDAPYFPDLAALCHEQRVKHAGQPADFGIVDWAKADLHPDLIEWADVIMVNCFPDTWIGGQWERIKHKRVIWRTIGQSNPRLEHFMRQFSEQGMQVVRYSPAERRAFEPIGVFAGEDAVIRFSKYPSDFGPWIGDNLVVGNVTQNLDVRGDHCGLDFWTEATKGLPVQLAGTGSERLGGIGELTYPAMLDYLSHLRAYLYMGTQPASYTLGLMEAMFAGVPVVSIGPAGMWMPDLFEGHEIANGWVPGWSGPFSGNDPDQAHAALAEVLVGQSDAYRLGVSNRVRQRAIDLFSVENVGPQWLAFLGSPARASFVRETVTAA